MVASYLMPDWACQYIGIPFVEHGRDHEGCDCWGLYRLIMAEQYGLDLPSLGETYDKSNRAEAAHSIRNNGTSTDNWLELPQGAEKLSDLLLMTGMYHADGRWHKAEMHVGFVITPGVILHIEQGKDSVLGEYRSDRRLINRVRGVYRNAERADQMTETR